MNSGAKLLSTAISARQRTMSPARALQAIIRARRIGARCETWIAERNFAPAHCCSIVAEREVCHRQREVRGSDKIVSRAEPQRELGVRLRLTGLAHGCLGKG